VYLLRDDKLVQAKEICGEAQRLADEVEHNEQLASREAKIQANWQALAAKAQTGINDLKAALANATDAAEKTLINKALADAQKDLAYDNGMASKAGAAATQARNFVTTNDPKWAAMQKRANDLVPGSCHVRDE
jgi:hypothetical protein